MSSDHRVPGLDFFSSAMGAQDVDPPSIVVADQTFTKDDAGSSYTPTITDLPSGAGYTVTLYDGSLPTGMTLNAATGQISGTPTALETVSLRLRVVDGSGQAVNSDWFSIEVQELIPPAGAFVVIDVNTLSGLSDLDPVGTWTNAGTEGDATATGAQRPTYRTAGGPGNGPRCTFSGTQYIGLPTWTEKAQPGILAACFSLSNLGFTNTVVGGLGTREWLLQAASITGRMKISTLGGSFTAAGNCVVNTWYWAIADVNGASSSLELSTIGNATGNAGFGGVTGMRLGRQASNNNEHHGGIAGVWAWPSGATTKAAVKTYLQARFPTL